MKRQINCLAIFLAAGLACLGFHAQAAQDSVEEAVDSVNDPTTETKNLLKTMDVREDILTAMEASGLLSGQNFLISDSGDLYFSDEEAQTMAETYSRLSPIAVSANSSGDCILAITEDGSLYQGETKICEGNDIREIVWPTDPDCSYAYFLSNTGGLYWYSPTSQGEDSYKSIEAGDIRFTAICRAGSHAIFFGEAGQLAGESSSGWGEISRTGWTNTVVAACALAEDQETFCTVAAICADGTVLAEGDYAEEILAMGDLSYLTMYDDASLIIGLTREGRLVFAGRDAENYSNIQLTNIAAVKAFGSPDEGNPVYAVGKDGTFYFIRQTSTSSGKMEAALTAARVDGACSEEGEYCLTASGELLSAKDGVWKNQSQTESESETESETPSEPVSETETEAPSESESETESKNVIDMTSKQTLRVQGALSVSDARYCIKLANSVTIKTSETETLDLNLIYLEAGPYDLSSYIGQPAAVTGATVYADGAVTLTIQNEGLTVNGELILPQEETESESEASDTVTLDGSLFADGQAVQSSTGYILPDSDSRYLSESDLSHLSLKGICYAKNEIYAKHHRKFLSAELTTYFMNTKWYVGQIEPGDFTESTVQALFNDYEKANVQLLSRVEGSMGYYQLDQ